MRTALKLVQNVAFYRREIELAELGGEHCHSLHSTLSLPEAATLPEIANWLIAKFTERNDVILDPFCRSGVHTLEASLLGRVAYGADTNPLGILGTRAKLEPADLTEVTLALQSVNLQGPVDLDLYRSYFSPFYDLDTFRELVNLKNFIRAHDNRTGRFIEALSLSLLHGHSAGYFSAYSFPQISVSPEEQERINMKRGQKPDYRAVVPRILRKCASVLRDGVPSLVRQLQARHRVASADPRNLAFVATNSVDFVITAPPVPFARDFSSDLWLKYWFAEISPNSVPAPLFTPDDPTSWAEFMNEVLVEVARVVRSRGRVAIDLPETRVRGTLFAFDELVLGMVHSQLSRLWDSEGVLSYKKRAARFREVIKAPEHSQFGDMSRVLILRRR